MDFGWVLQVNFQDVASFSIVRDLRHIKVLQLLFRHPVKLLFWQLLRHGPSIEVVGVQIHQVVDRFGWIVVVNVRVVGLSKLLGYHGHTASNA